MAIKKPVIFHINERYEILKTENISKITSFSENFKNDRLLKIVFHNAGTQNFLTKNNEVSFNISSNTGVLNIRLKTDPNSSLKSKLFDYTIITNQLLYSDSNKFYFSINATVESCIKELVDDNAHYYLTCNYIEKDSLKIINNGKEYEGLKI